MNLPIKSVPFQNFIMLSNSKKLRLKRKPKKLYFFPIGFSPTIFKVDQNSLFGKRIAKIGSVVQEI